MTNKTESETVNVQTPLEKAPVRILTYHLQVRGRVQGVSYRASARDEAVRLSLAGWVRNRSDGSVEMLVSGEAEAVEAMVDWAREGPAAAVVTQVEISAGDAPVGGDFEILPTA